LFVTVIGLVTVGLLNLYSATYRTPHSGKFDAQLMWIGIGLVAFFVLAYVDYRSWHRLAWFSLGGAVLLMVLVRLFAEGDGAQRWLHISAGGLDLRVQPSELAKIAVILALARVLHDRGAEELRASALAAAGVALAIPVLLIATQPDLGT